MDSNNNGTWDKIFKTFESAKFYIDPTLRNVTILSSRDFEAFKRELFSRKRSFRTVKGCLYCNGDFLSFVKKESADIADIQESDIKGCLLRIAEGRRLATSTFDRDVNFLKYYYGKMPKRKIVYTVKRSGKGKKLPAVSSQEEVAKILNLVGNLKQWVILFFKNKMGIECLGSSMTRAVSSIFHRNFIKAFSYNKLAVVIFPFLCLLCFYDLLLMISRLLNRKRKVLTRLSYTKLDQGVSDNEY